MEIDPRRNYTSYFFYLLSSGNYTIQDAVRKIIQMYLTEKDGDVWKLWNIFLTLDEKYVFQNLLTKIYNVTHERVDGFIESWKKGMDGDALAAAKIGHTFRNMNDMRNTFVWYSKSSEYGNVDATMDLAFCHLNGIGTKKDLAMASVLYYRIAYPPDGEPRPVAIHNLAATYYRNGENEKSIEHLKNACRLNHAPSWREMGKLYIKKKLSKSAIICLKKAVKLGDQMAGFFLACCPGKPVDDGSMLKLASEGCFQAALVYGFRILTGIIPLGWREGKKYILICYGRCENDSPMENYCVHLLRYLEFFGDGVDPRPIGVGEEYTAWCAKRLKISLPDPIDYARWYRDMGDMNRAHSYFNRVINQKDTTSPLIVKEAYINLGYIYLLRLTGPQYPYSAHEMFIKAVELETNATYRDGFNDTIMFIRSELEKDPKNAKLVHDLWMADGLPIMAEQVLERVQKKDK